MKCVTLSDLILSEMSGAELVEVRNAAGQVVGFFAPTTLEHAAQYAALAAKAHPAVAAGYVRPAKTTAEMLAHLDTLGAPQ